MATNTTRAYTPAGILAAAGGVFTWGLGVVIIKSTTSSFVVVSFWRHLLSLPLLAVAWRLSSWRTGDRALPWRAAGAGGVLFAAHQLANFSALRYASAAVVTILFSIQPIIIGSLGSRFAGESATKRFYLWSTVAVAGCAVVVVSSTGDATTTPLGAALSVTNLVVWCAYYLASKRGRESTSALSWMLVMIIVSGAIVTLVALAVRAPVGDVDARELTLLALLALLPGTIGHVLVTWAHPRIHIAASSALVLGVPIVGTIGTAIFVGERLSMWSIGGIAIALVATGIAMRHLPPPAAVEVADTYGELAS